MRIDVKNARIKAVLWGAAFLLIFPHCAPAEPARAAAAGFTENSDAFFNRMGTPVSFYEDRLKVKIGGQSRYRFEYRDDFNLNSRTYEDDAVNLLRHRLNLDIIYKHGPESPYFRFFAEGQSAQSFARSSVNKTNAFRDDLDLRQLFGEAGYESFSVRAGRQELSYGDERLVGGFNWNNVSRTFDAVKAVYKPRDWFQLDLFFSQVVLIDIGQANSAAHHDNFYGIYSSVKPVKDHVLDTFLFIRNNRDEDLRGERPGRTGPLKEYTAGNRFKGKYKAFDYGTEYAVQSGSRAHEDIAAWAFHQEAGYTFTKAPWTPRLFAEYNHASGDRNPSDGRFETFDNLFPTNHGKYGHIDFFSWKNMNNIKIGAGAKPHARLSAAAEYHWFFLDAKESPWFQANGSVFRAANPRASTTAGQELDLIASYKLSEHIALLGGYSHFFAGPFAEDTGAHDDADFFYIQTQLAF